MVWYTSVDTDPQKDDPGEDESQDATAEPKKSWYNSCQCMPRESTMIFIVVVNVVLLLVYIGSFIATGNMVQIFTIPWSYRLTFLDLDLPDKVEYDDPDLISNVLQHSGCDGVASTLADALRWGEIAQSGLCTCLQKRFHDNMEPLKDQSELSRKILSCMLSSKGATIKGIYDKHSTLWATNTASLIGLWNILAMLAIGVYIRLTMIYIISLSVFMYIALVPLCLHLTLPAILSYVFTVIIFSVIVILLTRKADKNVISKRYSHPGYHHLGYTVLWMKLMLVIPISVILFNVTTQRKDILFNISTILIVASMVAGAIGAYYANRAIDDLLKPGSRYNIANYIGMSNIISTLLLFTVSYEYMVPNISGNMSATSAIVLLVLLSALQFQNSVGASVDSSTRQKYIFMITLETIARGVATISMILDLRAVSV
jgi:hypothetical protein